MAKTRTSKKPKKSLTNTPKKKLKLTDHPDLEKYSPSEEICEGKLFQDAFWECVHNNDPEGAVEMLEIYLNAVNKKKQREKHNLPKSTMYNSFKNKNPTIKTLCKMIHCCVD